ncbi:hypothetical protein M426DRAFT_17540 [Hypoxylon sp. CI-4A]|nr:hypothetical protein M426DRAFT_17540 [Hypoxylon sp. CI-4A]
MCWFRRIYFSCRHEDMNVTPPRPIKPCENALRTGTPQRPKYCHTSGLERTRRNDWANAIVRERPCIPCEQRQIRARLDQDWQSFMRQNLRRLAQVEVTHYEETRRRIFDNYYLDWMVEEWRKDRRQEAIGLLIANTRPGVDMIP